MVRCPSVRWTCSRSGAQLRTWRRCRLPARGYLPARRERPRCDPGIPWQDDLCGTSFGVYKLLPHGSNEEIDIAFPRTDHAPEDTLGGAREIIAQSDPGMPYEQDVLRRDFTINGGALRIAWTKDGEATATFVDYTYGSTN